METGHAVAARALAAGRQPTALYVCAVCCLMGQNAEERINRLIKYTSKVMYFFCNNGATFCRSSTGGSH